VVQFILQDVCKNLVLTLLPTKIL